MSPLCGCAIFFIVMIGVWIGTAPRFIEEEVVALISYVRNSYFKVFLEIRRIDSIFIKDSCVDFN